MKKNTKYIVTFVLSIVMSLSIFAITPAFGETMEIYHAEIAPDLLQTSGVSALAASAGHHLMFINGGGSYVDTHLAIREQNGIYLTAQINPYIVVPTSPGWWSYKVGYQVPGEPVTITFADRGPDFRYARETGVHTLTVRSAAWTGHVPGLPVSIEIYVIEGQSIPNLGSLSLEFTMPDMAIDLEFVHDFVPTRTFRFTNPSTYHRPLPNISRVQFNIGMSITNGVTLHAIGSPATSIVVGHVPGPWSGFGPAPGPIIQQIGYQAQGRPVTIVFDGPFFDMFNGGPMIPLETGTHTVAIRCSVDGVLMTGQFAVTKGVRVSGVDINSQLGSFEFTMPDRDVVLTLEHTFSLNYEQWNPSVVYFTGDRVVHNGLLYEARFWTLGHMPDGHNAYNPWLFIGNEILPWRADISYNQGAVVSFNGKTFRAPFFIAAAQVPGPGTYWIEIS